MNIIQILSYFLNYVSKYNELVKKNYVRNQRLRRKSLAFFVLL